MSAAQDARAARRSELVARAAKDRAAVAELLAPIAKLDRGLEKLREFRSSLPGSVISTGLALSAMLLALPAGRSPIVRGGVAILQLAASVKRLFTRT